ncbi:hypothetical protein ZHAS_00017639 [Anopheles sinensis]|uniref:Uncharacterized protein n=1 Tax=Anopheles sinensis TaxID=74873 RepID=A0A084WHC9_ANOSI|nr:hypothetical protein ZHAS_00017639 [Anopheles sinensis]
MTDIYLALLIVTTPTTHRGATGGASLCSCGQFPLKTTKISKLVDHRREAPIDIRPTLALSAQWMDSRWKSQRRFSEPPERRREHERLGCEDAVSLLGVPSPKGIRF